MATPIRKPAVFVAKTGRSANTRMSTSGSLVRRSSQTNAASTAMPPTDAGRASRGDPQPQALALVIAEQQRRQAERQHGGAAPVDARAHARGRRGTRHQAANAAGRAISPIQNSQEMCALSTITPDSGRPMPPPMPNMAETRPIATARFSPGSSSLMIPKASGKTPPATPWMTRPAIRSSIDPAERADDRPDAEDHEHEREHAALAEQVAELAGERRADRRGQQVAGQHPARGATAVVSNSPAMCGSAGRDHRLRERVGQRGEQERAEHGGDGLAVNGVGHGLIRPVAGQAGERKRSLHFRYRPKLAEAECCVPLRM